MTLALVFPGQGSQSVGMQNDLPGVYDTVAETYAEASDVLGFDLLALVSHGPAEALNQTVNTQPAMLVAGVATWRAWLAENGAQPALMAGHSLGEYSALVCSGSLSFRDAVSVVRRRAELMQDAVPAGEGGMAAVLGLDDEVVVELCAEQDDDGVVEAVNFNSPGQVVVAGNRVAVERLLERAKAAGARRAMMLPVSVPAHSSLMRPAGQILAEMLDATPFKDGSVPVICAVDGKPYGNAADIRTRVKSQVFSPVRWNATVASCVSAGVTSIVECGPGKVLSGLVRRIDRNIATSCVDSSASIRTAIGGGAA